VPVQHFGTSLQMASLAGVTESVRCTVVQLGALPNATSKNVAHGINLVFEFGTIVDIVVIAAALLVQRKFPDLAMSVGVDLINVVLTSNADLSAFTQATAYIYYYKT